jgi:hypothetical protein
MISAKARRLLTLPLFLLLLCLLPGPSPAATLSDLFGKQELDEAERAETIERIQSIQEKLELLQEKLKALERRKAAKEAAERADAAQGVIAATPVEINWSPVDETTTDPGPFGLYTYLLFNGELSDSAAVGILEDFILTIETLPDNDIPATLANRFLVPVEKPQSLVSLGRQPYDFKLNETYLKRLGMTGDLQKGPVLVSSRGPIDPYASGDVPAFLAVSIGHQAPERAAQLAGIWNRQEVDAVSDPEQPISRLFWELIDGAGPIQVVHNQQHVTVTLPD